MPQEKKTVPGLWREKNKRKKEAEEKKRLEKEQEQQTIEEWRRTKDQEGNPIPFDKPEEKN